MEAIKEFAQDCCTTVKVSSSLPEWLPFHSHIDPPRWVRFIYCCFLSSVYLSCGCWHFISLFSLLFRPHKQLLWTQLRWRIRLSSLPVWHCGNCNATPPGKVWYHLFRLLSSNPFPLPRTLPTDCVHYGSWLAEHVLPGDHRVSWGVHCVWHLNHRVRRLCYFQPELCRPCAHPWRLQTTPRQPAQSLEVVLSTVAVSRTAAEYICLLGFGFWDSLASLSSVPPPIS